VPRFARALTAVAFGPTANLVFVIETALSVGLTPTARCRWGQA
jgi:hypothetical protein